jgi:hypothetical protein
MESHSAARTILLSLLLTMGSSIGLHALTFSLAGNWNSSADVATDEWSYGTFTTAGNPSTFVVPADKTNSGSTENFWTFPPAGGEPADPNVEKNLTGSAIFTAGAEFLPGTVSFGPFQGPAVAQFIAPTAGVYDITATFTTDQIRSGTSDGTTGYVYVGGALKYSHALSDPGHAQFGTAETLAPTDFTLTAGEKVDFVLGGGAFTSEVDATLTELPEPSVYAMMSVAGLLLFWGLRCRNASVQA